MPSSSSYADVARLSQDELRAEILRQSAEVAKIRMGISQGNEKNHAKLRKERTHLAHLHTALSAALASQKQQLKAARKDATVPAPSSRTR